MAIKEDNNNSKKKIKLKESSEIVETVGTDKTNENNENSENSNDTITSSETTDNSSNSESEKVIIKIKNKPKKKIINYISSLDDLISILETRKRKRWLSSYEKRKLTRIIPPLNRLNKMIGMKELKMSIINQVLYYIQNLNFGDDGMMHTSIEGPP